ncbi:hypothetical protein E2C01_014499 [Portunus trituberculatus]|uniref:Uncharacterized protein n=1 Tax=Portunus trituberculatus TaxID=210409 RepID=A0A5B7DJC7_PORTR|nr:hypothetical protein [Portunus trituberculatus]
MMSEFSAPASDSSKTNETEHLKKDLENIDEKSHSEGLETINQDNGKLQESLIKVVLNRQGSVNYRNVGWKPTPPKESAHPRITMSNIESSPLLQPAVKVEIKKEDSQRNLSQKSENSSDNVKKATADSHSEKESLGKSKESLSKSTASLERKKLTQSGEFLNDFISTIDSNEVKKNETVCEIHTEKEKVKLMDDQDHQSKMDTKNAENHERKSKTSESSCSDEEEPFISTQETKSLQTSSPLKINEAISEQHEEIGESEMIEVDKIDSDLPNIKREKAIPKIDTSRTSGYYECSMPTPLSVESHGSQNNTVFLFINPETDTTEDDIHVVHGGKERERERESSNTCRVAAEAKYATWLRYKRNPTQRNKDLHRAACRRMVVTSKWAIKKWEENLHRKLCGPGVGNQTWWSLVKDRQGTGHQESIPPLSKQDGTVATSSKERAQLLASLQTSESLPVEASVPQDSILGPLLQNIYVDDLQLLPGVTAYAGNCTLSYTYPRQDSGWAAEAINHQLRVIEE